MATATLTSPYQSNWNEKRWLDGALFIVVLVLSSTWCMTSSSRLGPTFDEPTYLKEGLHAWRTGSYKPLMKLGTMPLPINLQTLPLYLVERWRGKPFDVDKEMATILPWARTVTLFFWGMLLLYGMLIGREVAGPWGGRLAILFLACEPSLLAHAGLATTDISITAFLLALGYHFSTSRESSWRFRVGLPALLYGLSLLAKASALVYGPLILCAIELQRVIRQGSWKGNKDRSWSDWARDTWQVFTPLRRDGTQIVVIGLIIVFFVIGSEWKPEVTFTKWARELPQGTFRETMIWTFDHLCLFTNAGEGIVQQIKHNIRGHGAYILGESWRRSIWYYFPLALTMKVTVSVLAAVVIGLLLKRKNFWTWPALGAAALLLFSFNARVQIGVRLVLPLIALGIVALAIALAQSLRDAERRSLFSWLTASVIVCAIGFNVWTCARIWPNGLTYVNELWGGSATGYYCLSDSNYDWGQGLKELAHWADHHDLKHVDVWYFGTDPSVHRPPFRSVALHTEEIDPESLHEHVKGPFLAVSTTFLYGSYLSKDPIIHYLKSCEPVERTTTYMIYDVERLQGEWARSTKGDAGLKR
jgi:hypothetical protein